eukprot:scpid100644/ scgid35756/ 
MNIILTAASQFERIGPAAQFDRTIKIEKELVDYLKKSKAENIFSTEFNHMKPVGSQQPRLYGLPKIHKPECPVRPIVSMTASPQYAISKWLCGILKVVEEHYCKHCVKDSFDFVEKLHARSVPSSAHICSFDVSRFTNVPITETIDICANALDRDKDLIEPWLPEDAFRRLMLLVTTGVEFSFNNIMYKQTDVAAIGSPLGPVLTNIFVGFCEAKVDASMWPDLYVFLLMTRTYFNTKHRDEFSVK